MTECKTKFFDVSVVKQWIGTAGQFIPKSLKPGCPGAPKETKESLTKWLVFQFQVMVVVCILEMVRWTLAGSPESGVPFAVRGILSAWISAWFTWFAFAEREPSCCCFGFGHIEGWKHMHLIWGILLILSAVSQVGAFVSTFLPFLSAGLESMAVDFIVYAVVVVFYVLYGFAMLGVGISLVKMGGKKAGIDVEVGKSEVGKAVEGEVGA
jgi:hypothetical protein